MHTLPPTPHGALDRRRFLGLAGGLAAALLGAECAAPADDAPQALAHPDLLATLGADLVRAVGVRYRQTVPAERDADALRAAILASRPWTSRLRPSRRPRVAELVRDDFAGGRTVVVLGWILSATEARQCALYSLLSA